jgi:D-3-phosphoglycerate dehydrogenase
MKVLVSDKLPEIGLKVLKEAEGIEVDVKTGLSPQELLEIIGEYDALIVRSSTKVTKELIERAKRLKVIGRAGAGVDNIDVEAATKRGIVVMNTPGGNAIAAAEHTIGLMLAAARKIPQAHMALKQGRWERERFTGIELEGKLLGVIGLGNIGRIVAEKAKGMGMRVLAYDPYIPKEVAEKKGIELVSFEELLKRSDVITLHVPKTKETIGMIDRKAFSLMKDGVILINCARGGIVDEEALIEACRSGKVKAAGLDVFSQEPLPPDHPILSLDNVVVTPHLGASTEEAQLNVAKAIAEQIVDYLKTGTIRNAVNAPSVDAKTLATIGPYLNLGKRMGSFLGKIIPFAIKRLIIEYQGEVTKFDLTPITSAVLAGLIGAYLEEGVNEVNATLIAKERGLQYHESKVSEAADFTSLISLKAETDGKEYVIKGTLFGKKEPRLVQINEYTVEAAPEGIILLIHTEDKPGVIGNIGLTLGQKGINIGNMQFGRDRIGGKSLCILHLDSMPNLEVLEALKALPHVLSVQLVEL